MFRSKRYDNAVKLLKQKR